MQELYLRKIGQLDALLSGEDDHAIEARDIIRSMITKVTVVRSSGSGEYGAELHGDLADILEACSLATTHAEEEKVRRLDISLPRSQLSVVAGARFELTTFRLWA